MGKTDTHKTKFKEERLYMSTNQNLMQHMRELIDRIKAADVAYYRDDNPTMTDREYDLLVDELKELEATTGLILSGSPTQAVSGEILKELTPVRHTKPMLSADKTKSVDAMLRFANGRPVVLSWKLDGLTIACMPMSRAEKSPQSKSDFYKEDIGMNLHKKNIELTGSLIYPIEVGEAAFIREADGMRMTSTVLRTEKISAQEICFETVNTNYHLHVKQEVSA